MHEQLRLLVKLQTLDLKVTELNRLISEPSSRIKLLEKKLLKEQKEVDAAKQKLNDLNKKRLEKEKDLEIEIEKIKETEKRLMVARTNKEYEAFLKEIAFGKELNRDIEEEIIDIMDEIEKMNTEINGRNSRFNAQKEILDREKKELRAKSYQFEKEMEEQIADREEIVGAIHSDLIEQYNIIKEKRHGVAVAPVENGTCHGCHLNIPPQLYNEIQKSDDLIFCPNCLRILYWENAHKSD